MRGKKDKEETRPQAVQEKRNDPVRKRRKPEFSCGLTLKGGNGRGEKEVYAL